MTPEEFKKLERGDIVRNAHIANGENFIVSANYGLYVTGVTTVDITNPPEWELVLKANHKRPSEKK